MGFRSENIKKFRVEKGLSRNAVAELFKDAGHNLSPRTISNWENGDSAPGADDLAVLATILDKPIEYFFVPIHYQIGNVGASMNS